MIFETHAHYDDAAYDEDRDILLASMQESQIEVIVNVGASSMQQQGCIQVRRQS